MGYFNQRQANYKWLVKQGKADTFNNPLEIKSYQEFMKSDFWYATRKRFLNNKTLCHGCALAKPLDVHHITYYNMFKPDLGQLLQLCRDCHFYLHSFRFEKRSKLRKINIIFKCRRGKAKATINN